MCNKVLAQDFKAHFKKEAKKGFTLAEVLITLAIIGVVAAMTIPAVIVNTNQAEFKTGLRKAVSVLNSAITMNKALTGESPYDNENLYEYLQQHMAIMKRAVIGNHSPYGGTNLTFYTTDGIRYEIMYETYERTNPLKLYESDVYAKMVGTELLGNCGSKGLAQNPDRTTEAPCVIMVDVNGDRKPSPKNVYSFPDISYEVPDRYSNLEFEVKQCSSSFDSCYKIADPKGRLLSDVFTIMITDQGAIPYGVVAQKAMYQAQK